MPSTPYAAKALPDNDRFRKKVFLKLAADPFFLVPFLAGVTDLLTLWTFTLGSGIALFAGIAAILGAAGYFFTRLVLGKRSLAKEALESLQQEARAEREKKLDDLDRRLSVDGDPRTETCLRDLRALATAFEEGRSAMSALNTGSTVDILAGVDQLFSRCVLSLEKTLELGYTAERMTSAAAREPILQERERIIAEVMKTIPQLGHMLAAIQALELDGSTRDSELANIRRELDQSLEVAKKVKERMQSMEKEFDLPDQ